MEIEVKIKIAMPDEVAENLGIDEDSVLESYYEDGYIYIRKVDDDELDELAHEYDDGTGSIDTFVTAICKWLVKIGVVVAMVGGVMFALGWQREDSEGKSRGLLTLMAGFMVAAIGASPSAFGFK